jgi:lipopolysaccharide/colanic/teichoic acid biosynthesis glycosyltransferase
MFLRLPHLNALLRKWVYSSTHHTKTRSTNDFMCAGSASNRYDVINGNGRQSPAVVSTPSENTQTNRASTFVTTTKRSSALRATDATPSGYSEHPTNPKAPTDISQIPFWKRLLDLTCIALTAPFSFTVMALVASWIRLVSPGPLLFRQERIGYRGRRFMLLKFRTMNFNAETQVHEGYFERLMQADCPMTKLDRHDLRLIRGGRPLRALGLDELPQLFNVLHGEMSLVGPRPCTPHEFERYQPAQKERVNAPPGLTGYWQVNGKNKTTFSQMIAMDIFYSKHMSPWMDLSIMLKTLPAIAVQVLESRTVRSTSSKVKAIATDHFRQLITKVTLRRKTN